MMNWWLITGFMALNEIMVAMIIVPIEMINEWLVDDSLIVSIIICLQGLFAISKRFVIIVSNGWSLAFFYTMKWNDWYGSFFLNVIWYQAAMIPCVFQQICLAAQGGQAADTQKWSSWDGPQQGPGRKDACFLNWLGTGEVEPGVGWWGVAAIHRHSNRTRLNLPRFAVCCFGI